jgi:hypothetical protein
MLVFFGATGDSRTRVSRWRINRRFGEGSFMAYDNGPSYRSRVAETPDYDLGLGAEWNERIATSVVVAVGVMIVAMIAVLMGMA